MYHHSRGTVCLRYFNVRVNRRAMSNMTVSLFLIMNVRYKLGNAVPMADMKAYGRVGYSDIHS